MLKRLSCVCIINIYADLYITLVHIGNHKRCKYYIVNLIIFSMTSKVNIRLVK